MRSRRPAEPDRLRTERILVATGAGHPWPELARDQAVGPARFRDRIASVPTTAAAMTSTTVTAARSPAFDELDFFDDALFVPRA
jgi:hypothetical protein